MKKLFLMIAIIATLSTNFVWASGCASLGWAQQCASYNGDGIVHQKYYVAEYLTVYVNSVIRNSGTTWANLYNGQSFGHYYNMSGTSYDGTTLTTGMGGGEIELFAHTIYEDTDAVITANW